MLDGHEVAVAEGGYQALAALDRSSYDLILMDLQMPRMDGLTATLRIRERSGPESAVPIIALTGNVLPEHLKEFAAAGVNDCITKPFRIDRLSGVVTRWLEESAKSHAPGAGPPVHRAEALDEARALMGSQWVDNSLIRLAENIDKLIAARTDGERDLSELKRTAHMMVSEAGQLGFAGLSQRSSELELACTNLTGIDQAVEQVRMAGQLALGAIDSMVANDAR
ncbi:MAG TPA: response regulator [Thermohalobaculum sp.]|nr:response regulator [Thermohalobaculum sp.]